LGCESEQLQPLSNGRLVLLFISFAPVEMSFSSDGRGDSLDACTRIFLKCFVPQFVEGRGLLLFFNMKS
jgi:hypothetical protein